MISFSVTAFTLSRRAPGNGSHQAPERSCPPHADQVVSQGQSRLSPDSLTDFGPGFMHLEPIGEHPYTEEVNSPKAAAASTAANAAQVVCHQLYDTGPLPGKRAAKTCQIADRILDGMVQVNADDDVTCYVLYLYAYDPRRRERRHQVITAADTERESQELFDARVAELRQRRAAGDDIDPREH